MSFGQRLKCVCLSNGTEQLKRLHLLPGKTLSMHQFLRPGKRTRGLR